MAVYFNLGLVARTREDVEACKAYFLARTLVVDYATIELEAFVHEGRRGDFLLGVWPKGMSYASPHGDDRRLTTEAAQRHITRFFDAALIDAPPFAAAQFGGEAYDYFLTGEHEEQGEPLESQLEGGFAGLHVDEALWVALGRPADAEKVGPARYRWARGSSDL